MKKFRGKYVNLYGDWKIGDNTRVGSFCDIAGIIGDDCKIQSYVFIPKGVEIGNRVFVGPGVKFTNVKRPNLKKKGWSAEKTIVKDDVAIGTGAIILPGITIEKGAFIGAGSVVTKDIPPYETWIGNPARFYECNCPKGYERCIRCGACFL